MLFVLGAQKYNQTIWQHCEIFHTKLNFCFFFGHDLGFKLIFGSGRVRAYIFGLELGSGLN